MIGTHPTFFILYALVFFRDLGINLRIVRCPVFQHRLRQPTKAFRITEDVNHLNALGAGHVLALEVLFLTYSQRDEALNDIANSADV